MLTQLFEQNNWMAIVIAAAAYWVIGAIWYGILGKRWMVAAGLTKEKIDAGSKMIYLYTFILEFFIVLVIAAILNYAAITELSAAIELGLLVGLVLSGFTTWVHYMYTGQKKDLYWIDAGYTTIASIVASTILVLMMN
jgi:hypothetical protein